MRVLLVHPGTSSLPSTYAYPPWGVLVVATALRESLHEAEVVDLNGRDVASTLPGILEALQPEVLGVTGKMGLAAERARQVGAISKQWNSGVSTVLGGPLVDAFGPALEDSFADYDAFLPGDGEVGLVRWIATGCPRGLQAVERCRNLDRVGIPTWWKALGSYVGVPDAWPGLDVPSIHVSSGRGCTGGCRFCYLAGPGGRRHFDYVSVNRMLQDLGSLSDWYGATGFFFVDDCFLDSRGHRLDALERSAFLRPEWRFGCDLQLWQLGDMRLLERLRRVGFRSFYVGLEAGNPRVRGRLGKRDTVDNAFDVLRGAIDTGFAIRASVGIGWPGETESDIGETLDLLAGLPEMKIDAFRYTPLPTAPLTAELAEHGRVVPSEGEWPYLDYCFRGHNFSYLPDEVHEASWVALLAMQDQRHGLVTMGENLVSRSEYDRLDARPHDGAEASG